MLQDGPTSIADIDAIVKERFGADGTDMEQLWDECLDILQAMYWEGVVDVT
jgi:hypothetical protein